MHYILDEAHRVIPCPDILKWAEWFEVITNRRVALTEHRKFVISTVFIGTDEYELFETMFRYNRRGRDARYLDCQARCSTWEEALQQHRKTLEWIKTGQATRGITYRPSPRRAIKRLRKYVEKARKQPIL